MDRSFSSNCKVVNESNEFILELRQSDISTFAIEFSMVMMELIDKLIVVFNGEKKLAVRLDKTICFSDKAIVVEKHGGVLFNLSKNHIEYLCAFLLRTYRDQVAEVNHLHIEGEKDGRAFDLTIMFEHFVEPMTPEEASKLMGD